MICYKTMYCILFLSLQQLHVAVVSQVVIRIKYTPLVLTNRSVVWQIDYLLDRLLAYKPGLEHIFHSYQSYLVHISSGNPVSTAHIQLQLCLLCKFSPGRTFFSKIQKSCISRRQI